MGTLSLHKYSKVCSVPTNGKCGCPYCQLFFCLFDRWANHVRFSFHAKVFSPFKSRFMLLIMHLRWHMLSGNAPLTAVQLLWVNMIMDTLGALALATEPPNNDLMKRLPVGRKGNFISNVMWRNVLGQSLYQFLIIWYLQTRGKAAFQLSGPDSDLILNTLIFNSFVFCQVIINCRILTPWKRVSIVIWKD